MSADVLFDAVVIYQSGITPLLPPPPSPEGWRSLQYEYRFTAKFSAALQQFNAFQPEGSITTARDGWRGLQYEYRFAKPVPAASQLFNGFEPQGVITSRFPDGWRGYQLEVRFTPLFPVTAQQFNAFEPAGLINSRFPEGWRSYQIDRFATPLPAALQQVQGALQPQAGAASNTAVNWQGLSPELFAKAVPASLQQFASLPPPLITLPLGAPGDLGDVQFEPKVIYQASVSPFAPPPPGASPLFGTDDEFSNVIQRPNVVYQAGGAPPTPYSNRQVNWQTLNPETFGKTFPAWQQQFLTLAPGNFPSVSTLVGDIDDFCNILLRPSIVYQAGGAPPLPPPPPPVAGVAVSFADVLFDTAVVYQAGVLPLRPITPGAFPDGWRGYQLDYGFGKAFSAALQQYAASGRNVASPSNTTTSGWQPVNAERFATTFPAALQQFLAIGQPFFPPPPPPVTPPQGGHGDWPRHTRKDRNVRPIWDRRPDAWIPPKAGGDDEPIPGEHPLGPDPLLGDGKDSAFLARALNPWDAPGAGPLQRKYKKFARGKAGLSEAEDVARIVARNPIAARATLTDLDTGSATVSSPIVGTALGVDSDESVTKRARARFDGAEDNDSLSTRVTWNDDEIAMQMLFGDDAS